MNKPQESVIMYGTTKAFVILKNILLVISNKIGVFRLGKNKAETDSANALWGKSVSKWWRKKNVLMHVMMVMMMEKIDCH